MRIDKTNLIKSMNNLLCSINKWLDFIHLKRKTNSKIFDEAEEEDEEDEKGSENLTQGAAIRLDRLDRFS